MFNIALPNEVRAALRTAAVVFVVQALLPVLGILQDVYEWASSNGREPLPGLSAAGFAVVAAFVAAVAGFGTFVLNYVQTKFNIGKPAAYAGSADLATGSRTGVRRTQSGQSTVWFILGIIGIIAIVLWLIS